MSKNPMVLIWPAHMLNSTGHGGSTYRAASHSVTRICAPPNQLLARTADDHEGECGLYSGAMTASSHRAHQISHQQVRQFRAKSNFTRGKSAWMLVYRGIAASWVCGRRGRWRRGLDCLFASMNQVPIDRPRKSRPSDVSELSASESWSSESHRLLTDRRLVRRFWIWISEL